MNRFTPASWRAALRGGFSAAAAVGVVMASLALVKRMADLELESMALTTDENADVHLTKEEHDSLTNSGDATLLINLSGPLAFGVANGLMKPLGDIGRHKSVVLDLSEVPHIDDITAFAFENIIRRAQNNDQDVILVGLHRPVIRVFIRTGLLTLIRQCVRFRRRLDGLNYARKIASN